MNVIPKVIDNCLTDKASDRCLIFNGADIYNLRMMENTAKRN